MAYSELFKNYSDIRNFMRRFYVYGFEKRQDFTAKSSRSYDDNRRRLDSWLEDYMSFKSEADGRAYRISFDSSSISHNPLYKSWKAKSFTSMDITLHFYLLDILVDGKAYSAAELLELLSGRYFDCFDNQLRQPDESTVRNKLNEYTALGMLRLVKQGRRNLYCLARDEVNWRSWQLACAFFSEAAPLGEAGSYLLDKFAEDCEAFAFKHHFILYTMDSKLMYELLEAMNSRQSITLYRCDKDGSSIPQYVCPLKIYCSTRTGRQYLLSYSYAAQKLLFNRLDHIESIEVKRAEERYEEFLRLAQERRRISGVQACSERTGWRKSALRWKRQLTSSLLCSDWSVKSAAALCNSWMRSIIASVLPCMMRVSCCRGYAPLSGVLLPLAAVTRK